MFIMTEDLHDGDECIIHGNGTVRYVKLLKTPTFSNKTNKYSSVKCLEGLEYIPTTYVGWNKTSVTYSRKSPSNNPSNFTKTCYVDFNYKSIWRVKTKENNINTFENDKSINNEDILARASNI